MSYELPTRLDLRAAKLTEDGIRIQVTPQEIVEKMKAADKALNGHSNDAEHDALYLLREWLSEIYEDTERRKKT